MHNTYLKGKLIWAIQSLYSYCTVSHQMRWFHTAQVHNSLRQLCYFNYPTFTFVGFAEASKPFLKWDRSNHNSSSDSSSQSLCCSCWKVSGLLDLYRKFNLNETFFSLRSSEIFFWLGECLYINFFDWAPYNSFSGDSIYENNTFNNLTHPLVDCLATDGATKFQTIGLRTVAYQFR